MPLHLDQWLPAVVLLIGLRRSRERLGMDLSKASEVEKGMLAVPVADRIAFLARAEAVSKERGDTEVLAAIAVWRLAHQVK